MLIILDVLTVLVNNTTPQSFTRLSFTLPLLSLFIALYLDIVQSIITGCIIGMLAAAYTRERLAARSLAAGLFLAAQLIFNAFVVFVVFGLLPRLPNAVVASISFLLIFFITRETMIFFLWRLLARRLGIPASELSRAVEVYS